MTVFQGSQNELMGMKLSPRDAELYLRVDEVLHYTRGPIGVRGMPMARDEYRGYVPTGTLRTLELSGHLI